jgi:hypothetical protein
MFNGDRIVFATVIERNKNQKLNEDNNENWRTDYRKS